MKILPLSLSIYMYISIKNNIYKKICQKEKQYHKRQQTKIKCEKKSKFIKQHTINHKITKLL